MARAEIQVIQVKRNIPLSEDEKVYKDYYLSGGYKDGLRINLVVPVHRWVSLREGNKAQEQAIKMNEPVGWLKILFAQDHLAVARLYELASIEESPIMDQPGIMLGDSVTLEKSFIAKPQKKAVKDSSQLQAINPVNTEVKTALIEMNTSKPVQGEKNNTQTEALESNPIEKENINQEKQAASVIGEIKKDSN